MGMFQQLLKGQGFIAFLAGSDVHNMKKRNEHCNDNIARVESYVEGVSKMEIYMKTLNAQIVAAILYEMDPNINFVVFKNNLGDTLSYVRNIEEMNEVLLCIQKSEGLFIPQSVN